MNNSLGRKALMALFVFIVIAWSLVTSSFGGNVISIFM